LPYLFAASAHARRRRVPYAPLRNSQWAVTFKPVMTDVPKVDWLKGVIAGTAATLAVSLLMTLEKVLGIAPELGLIQLLLRAIEAPADNWVTGWVIHLLIGCVFGGMLFAWAEPRLEGNTPLKKGVLFGLLLWLAFMLAIMPAAGAGLFGFELSELAPAYLLLLHVVYGVVLGWTYGKVPWGAALCRRSMLSRS
jgi:uncharacterized protein DUF6789